MQNRHQNRNQSNAGRNAGHNDNEDRGGAQWGADTDWESNRGIQGRPDEQQGHSRSGHSDQNVSGRSDENRNAGSWRGGFRPMPPYDGSLRPPRCDPQSCGPELAEP